MRLHGEKLRWQRKQLGMTQAEVAAEARVSRRTVQKAEACEPGLKIGSIEAIADVLDLDPEEVLRAEENGLFFRRDPGAEEDAFLGYPWSLFYYLRRPVLPGELALCESLADAKRVIHMMRHSWALHLQRAKCDIPKSIFVEADRKLSESLDQWEQKYISIWMQNKRSLFCSSVKGQRTGVSVVLPVTDRAYEEVRAGRLSYMDIAAGDIQDDSQSLILDSAVEFAGAPKCPWFNLTDSLGFGVFCQIAMLAQNPTATDFRMLSFGASSANIKRLQKVGFVETGTLMPNLRYPLLEFQDDGSDLIDELGRRSATTANFIHIMQRCFSSSRRGKAKRMAMRRALKLYQKVVNPRFLNGAGSSKKSAA